MINMLHWMVLYSNVTFLWMFSLYCFVVMTFYHMYSDFVSVVLHMLVSVV